MYIFKPLSPENVSWNCRFNQVLLNYDFEPILWWVLLLECAQREVWLLFCFNFELLIYHYFNPFLNTFWYSSAMYFDFIQFLENSHPPNVYFWIFSIFSNLLTILYKVKSRVLTRLINPIPTGHGRNQPIYESHATTAGRNRVNHLYTLRQ